jgi:hypothetical protein
MTEEILRILLSDLSTVRIKCAKCSVVTEMALDKLAAAFEDKSRCSHCGHEFDEELRRAFKMLSNAVSKLRAPFELFQTTTPPTALCGPGDGSG